MSERKTPSRLASVYASCPAGGPTNAQKVNSRHAAITDNVNNWMSYTTWAQRIRDTWKEDK